MPCSTHMHHNRRRKESKRVLTRKVEQITLPKYQADNSKVTILHETGRSSNFPLEIKIDLAS